MSIKQNITRLSIRNYYKVGKFVTERQHDAVPGYCEAAAAAVAVDADLQVQRVVCASCLASHFAAPSPASSHMCMH